MASFHIFQFLLLIIILIDAQSPPTENPINTNRIFSSNFSASTAVIIVLLIISFSFLAFFSIYIRHCRNNGYNFSSAATATTAAAGFIHFESGLNPELLETFPIMIYSQVKPHKIENCALECAICLNEFDDEDVIRLLPGCDHVFHLDCIDAWLDTHVTCPVCRTNYNLYSVRDEPPAAAAAEAVQIRDEIAVDDMERRKEEMRELAILANKVRRNGQRKSRRLSRCHSTGHLMMAEGEGSFNRYTLRLPENLRKEIIAAGSLRKARTFAVARNVGGGGEGSMRKVSRGVGEGSSRRGRTIYLGRSDRWPSFFGRSLSARISSFGNWRKGEEGGVKESP